MTSSMTEHLRKRLGDTRGQVAATSKNNLRKDPQKSFNIDDKKGQYHFSFEVYGKKEDKFGNKVERVVLADKRSTFYVPKIQGD